MIANSFNPFDGFHRTGRKFYLAFLVFSYQNFLLAWKWEMHVDLIRMRRMRRMRAWMT